MTKEYIRLSEPNGKFYWAEYLVKDGSKSFVRNYPFDKLRDKLCAPKHIVNPGSVVIIVTPDKVTDEGKGFISLRDFKRKYN